MSWFGYASLVSIFFEHRAHAAHRDAGGLWHGSGPAPRASVPILGLFLGLGQDGGFSFLRGMVFAGRLARSWWPHPWSSARSVRNGEARRAGFDTLLSRPGAVRTRSSSARSILSGSFATGLDRASDPDPGHVAGFSCSTFRGILSHAAGLWYYLSGAAALISFGSSAEIADLGRCRAMDRPDVAARGLEGVLKAKARLWSMIASGTVVAVLLASCWFLPAVEVADRPGRDWLVLLCAQHGRKIGHARHHRLRIQRSRGSCRATLGRTAGGC